MVHSQYVRENNGTTCQLALTNVEKVSTKVVAMDKKLVGWQWFDTRSVKWMVSAYLWSISIGALVKMQIKHCFYSRNRNPGCQWHVEAVAGAVGPAIAGSCSTDSASRNDTANVANIPQTTIFNWHINTNHDLHKLYLCTDQESNWWQSNFYA